jgi:DNA segregation ATPase FtsK/SpoIIIE-like protein
MNKVLSLIIQLLRRIAGIFVVILAFYLATVLISFDSNDPSFNTFSTSQNIINYGGLTGAKIADLCYQFIGLSSFILVIFIFSFGLQLIDINGIEYCLTKIIIMPFAILCFSLFFSIIPQPQWWQFSSLGGVNGLYLKNLLFQIPIPLLFLLSLSLGVFLFSVVVEVSIKDWIYFIRYTIAWSRYLLNHYILNLKSKKPLPINSSISKNLNEIVDKEIIENDRDDDSNEDLEDLSNEEEKIIKKTTNQELKTELKSSKIKKPKKLAVIYISRIKQGI